MADEPRRRRAKRPPHSANENSELVAFCQSLLDKKVKRSGRSPEDSCEIDLGSRFGAASLFETPPPSWHQKYDDYPDLPDGDIEPIGYSFEVMVHDQYLVRRSDDGGYLIERRRRSVLSPKVIAETS